MWRFQGDGTTLTSRASELALNALFKINYFTPHHHYCFYLALPKNPNRHTANFGELHLSKSARGKAVPITWSLSMGPKYRLSKESRCRPSTKYCDGLSTLQHFQTGKRRCSLSMILALATNFPSTKTYGPKRQMIDDWAAKMGFRSNTFLGKYPRFEA
jgi:hypothetical protein